MKSRRYTELDYMEMCKWWEKRGLPAPSKEYLPKIGYLVEDMAAGFLYQTDGNIGLLDMYITNSEQEPNQRVDSLRAITTSLLGYAKQIGIKAIKFDTKFDVIKILATENGFIYTGEHSSYFKEI